MKHLKLISALLLVSLLGSFVPDAHAQAATRVTPCSATTPNNALCLAWTHDGKTMDGTTVSGVTFRMEQKFGTGAYATVASAIAGSQYFAQNLAVGTYTFRVFANCTAAPCIESSPSNETSKGATANPIQPTAPVLIIAATIRADGPPTFRIVYTVTPRAGEVIFVAPASLRPYVAAR